VSFDGTISLVREEDLDDLLPLMRARFGSGVFRQHPAEICPSG